MRLAPRRIALCSVVGALLFPSAASAVCATTVCVEPTSVGSFRELLDVSGGGGDGSGVLCVFIKFAGDPPERWTGGSAGGPYVWVDDQRWGLDNPGEWDRMDCPPVQIVCEQTDPLVAFCPWEP